MFHLFYWGYLSVGFNKAWGRKNGQFTQVQKDYTFGHKPMTWELKRIHQEAYLLILQYCT